MARTWKWRKLDDTKVKLDELVRFLNTRLAALSDSLEATFAQVQALNTFPGGAATPSVFGASVWKTNNPVPTNITGFSDGTAPQRITIWAGDANTTIINSAGLRTKTGANVALGVNSTIEFVTVDGISWREV